MIACVHNPGKTTIVAPDGTRYVGDNDCCAPSAYSPCGMTHTFLHSAAVAAAEAGENARGGVAYIEGEPGKCLACEVVLSLGGIEDVRYEAAP